MTHLRYLILSSLLLAGCKDAIDLDPIDTAPVVESTVRPSPILGGTMVLTDDGTAIAADPDRDLIHIVDLDARQVRHTIALKPGDQPHRIALGSGNQAHVVLRGAGGIATFDLDAGTVTARHALCPEPRGIAYHDVDASLYVACAGGSLFHLSEAGEVLERHELEPDLRDVLIVDGAVKVTLFRAAAIIGLDGSRIEIPRIDEHVPQVAWRTWVTPTGDIAMLHQMASTAVVPINPGPDELPDGGSPYGGGGGCELGLVHAALTTISASYGGITTVQVLDSNLTVDAAFSPDDTMVAMAVPGARRPEDITTSQKKSGGLHQGFEPDFIGGGTSTSTVRVDPKDSPNCGGFSEPMDAGQTTAVAYSASGRLAMQSREPAMITVFDIDGSTESIPLPGDTRFDTGHEIFHRATDSGLSCASCHPEGTDDGHVWEFAGLGPRRTQPIDVGLRDTAPYHWDGDMPDVDVLMAEVLAHRMGGKRQSPARADSFTRWLFDQQRPAALGVAEPSQVATGKQLFASYDCGKCHTGPGLGGDRTETIAGEAKQVPTLRRVSLHPPYMHDGRAKTLEAAIQDMVTTTKGSAAPDADVAAMAAYLRTL